jgi:hypothetical protein
MATRTKKTAAIITAKPCRSRNYHRSYYPNKKIHKTNPFSPTVIASVETSLRDPFGSGVSTYRKLDTGLRQNDSERTHPAQSLWVGYRSDSTIPQPAAAGGPPVTARSAKKWFATAYFPRWPTVYGGIYRPHHEWRATHKLTPFDV